MANIPPVRTINRQIRRVRSGQTHSMNYSNISQISFTDEQTTCNDENILLHDSGPEDPSRFFIFGSAMAIDFMRRSNIIQSDGTFKVAPRLFEQLYVIHGTFSEVTVPVFFVLMPNRTEETYKKVFAKIVEICGGEFSSNLIITDFEIAAINAYHATNPFSECTLQGCYYHFQQSHYKKIQNLGLAKRYNNELEFACDIRLLSSLAFVPINDVRNVFDSVSQYLVTKYGDLLDDYILYFQRNYVGITIGERLREPRFAIRLWNLHDTAISSGPRTNNSVEGYNHAMNSSFGMSHPTVQKFVEQIKKEIVKAKIKATEVLNGTQPQPKRPRFREITERLNRITSTYETYANKMDFVKQIARIYSVV